MVVNWNRRELLRACLSSLGQQRNVDFEIIVVDNGSSDGSAELAEREFGTHVIRNRENRGFCAANNQGIAAARGEWIALLNNDAEAEPDWLAALKRACSGMFRKRKEIRRIRRLSPGEVRRLILAHRLSLKDVV